MRNKHWLNFTATCSVAMLVLWKLCFRGGRWKRWICYVRQDMSPKQRKTRQKEAWRPKCSAPRLGYEQNQKAAHWVIATMQTVVTGQAPITLEWKITSGGKQKKTEDTHNHWNKSHTSDKKNKRGRSYTRMWYISYAKRVATFVFSLC